MPIVPVKAEVIVVRSITDLVPYETGVSTVDEAESVVLSDSVEEPEPVVEPEVVEFEPEPVGTVVLLPASPGKTSPASHCCSQQVAVSRLARACNMMPAVEGLHETGPSVAATYVFHNAASLPPEPVDHGAKARVIVEPPLGVDVQGAKHLNVEGAPDRAEHIQRGVRAVVSTWVVVLFWPQSERGEVSQPF